MSMITHLSLVLLYSSMWISESITHCPYEYCLCGDTYLLCKDPSTGPQSTVFPPLNIDLNHANEISDAMLPANLSEFYLTNNPIQIIDDNTFTESTTTLITVSFTNCSLTKIPNAFLKLQTVKYITFTDTKIQEWNEPVMLNFAITAQTLSLSNVGLTAWPSWIKQFSQLTDLVIQSSVMPSIPDDAFDLMISNLTTLTLSNNKLTTVPKALSKLINLNVLYLENNLITNLTWLPPSKMLNALSLNGNKLSDSQHLSNMLSFYTGSLTHLELNHNKLTSLPDLDSLTSLGTVDFSYNVLSNLALGSLPPSVYDVTFEYNFFSYIPIVVATLNSVTSLDMPSNSILEIRGSDFSLSITYVDLENNLLTELDHESFPENNKIYYLTLSNNPITHIGPTAFVRLTNLTNLILTNSRLTRLPLALLELNILGSLDLSGSSYLICTCLEKDLEPWVKSRTPESILGDCGTLSIYNFFTMLSSDCPS